MTVKNRSAGRERMRHTPEPKVIYETEGDVYLSEVDRPAHHTFRMFNQSGEFMRGVYYSDSKRSYTFLHRHENLEDVLSTTEHENLHAAIDQCREWEYEDLSNGKMLEKDMIFMDDNEEHNMIRIAIWNDEYENLYT